MEIYCRCSAKESVMIVKSSYDSAGDVPQEFKDSFKEVDGKFVFTGQIDVKTQDDVDKILGAKKHIDTELSDVKELLKAEKQGKADIQSKLEVAELKISRGADLEDNEEIQGLVAKLVNAKTTDISSQLDEANEKIAGFQSTIYGNEKSEFVTGIVSSFSDTVKGDASFMLNQIFERQADNTYLTKEGLGLEAGLNAEQATAKLLETRPHWAKSNTAGNSQGGGKPSGDNGSNPFKKDTFNRTEQHKLRLENPQLAQTLEAQANKE